MPIYEFECVKCHNRFERLQRFSDPPPQACPTCGAEVSQMLSAPAIQFKGSGWYVTDYAKKNSGPAPSSGNGKNGKSVSAEGSAPKSDGKSESKKSEPKKSD